MPQSRYQALVVEDEGNVRQLTMRALASAGFQCQPARDGVEARQLFDQQHFHTVITDLRMPVEHGYKLITYLLGREHRPAIVVLTGVVEPRLERHLREQGVDDVIYKPVNYVEFAQEVAELTARHYARCAPPTVGAAEAAVSEQIVPSAAVAPVEQSNESARVAPLGEERAANKPESTRIPPSPAMKIVAAERPNRLSAPAWSNTATIVERPPANPGVPTVVLPAPPPSYVTLQSAASTPRRLRERMVSWPALAFSVALAVFLCWFWLQLQLIRQTDRAITAMERVGAAFMENRGGGVDVRFAANKRPAELQQLQQVANLNAIDLTNTSLTDEDLRVLGRLVHLRKLDLRGTQISSRGVRHLRDLQKLEELDLTNTRVDDRVLEYVRALTGLRELGLIGTDVSTEAIRNLQQDLPALHIRQKAKDDMRGEKP
jgi:DNA-binding response OmpR family regulator